jgi:hypothetical protein
MSQGSGSAATLATRIKAALQSDDPDAFGDLLTADARWGAPDDPDSGCHNRGEVLSWYKAARDLGMRAEVTEAVVGDGKLLVGVRISGPPAAGEGRDTVERWQVMTVRNDQVADIRGFEDRTEAARRAGVRDQ